MAEALDLALLLRERLDYAHARDVLLRVGGQLGDPLLGLSERRLGMLAVPVRDQHDERHGRQGERGQLGLEHEHGDPGQRDGQHRLCDEDEAVAEEEPHRLQVDRRARHELPGLLAVEEAELESLELLVEPVTQVDLDAERHLPGDEPARSAQAEPEQPGDPDRDHPHDQRMAVVISDRVDRLPGQERDQDGHDHRPGGEHKRPRDGPPVGVQETEESSEYQHFIKYSKGVGKPRSGMGFLGPRSARRPWDRPVRRSRLTYGCRSGTSTGAPGSPVSNDSSAG